MSYPRSRSATAELAQGAIDGTYKLVTQNRGGVIDPATYAARKDLADVWSGIHEQFVKVLPDGRPAVTAYFEATDPAQVSV